MAPNFDFKKKHILSSLARDNETYTDLSPKGSVDEGIRDLVNEINATEDHVTTSSCSGRIAVFLEGSKKASSNVIEKSAAGDGDDGSASVGGKGGGEWLFTSHGAVDLASLGQPGAVFKTLGLLKNASVSFPSTSEAVRYVHFKFEPMILHILTSSPFTAQSTLNAALSAGFRESGISSILDSQSPMVAVRTSGLALDSLIGFTTSAHGSSGIQLMVSEEYLHTLIRVANERFEVNALRTARFRSAFRRLNGGAVLKGGKEFEPMDVRKERMRREGLQRKEALGAVSAAANSNGLEAETNDHEGDSYEFDTLLLGDEKT